MPNMIESDGYLLFKQGSCITVLALDGMCITAMTMLKTTSRTLLDSAQHEQERGEEGLWTWSFSSDSDDVLSRLEQA